MRIAIHEWITNVRISVVTTALKKKANFRENNHLYYTPHCKYILILRNIYYRTLHTVRTAGFRNNGHKILKNLKHVFRK